MHPGRAFPKTLSSTIQLSSRAKSALFRETVLREPAPGEPTKSTRTDLDNVRFDHVRIWTMS